MLRQFVEQWLVIVTIYCWTAVQRPYDYSDRRTLFQCSRICSCCSYVIGKQPLDIIEVWQNKVVCWNGEEKQFSKKRNAKYSQEGRQLNVKNVVFCTCQNLKSFNFVSRTKVNIHVHVLVVVYFYSRFGLLEKSHHIIIVFLSWSHFA